MVGGGGVSTDGATNSKITFCYYMPLGTHICIYNSDDDDAGHLYDISALVICVCQATRTYQLTSPLPQL